jgi:hypothetical protein
MINVFYNAGNKVTVKKARAFYDGSLLENDFEDIFQY